METKKWSAEEKINRLIHREEEPPLFSAEQYMSGDGMQTAIFGPVFWTAIHLVSFNYPVNPSEQQKIDYENWLHATGRVLPCSHCRNNFEKNFEAAKTPDFLDNRDTFSRFCYRLHDNVNRMIGKKSPHTFNEVRDIYEGFRSRCLTQEEEDNMKKTGEAGCVAPFYAEAKGKCIIEIVPRDKKCVNLRVAEECRIHRQN